jgi:hypothetical protein
MLTTLFAKILLLPDISNPCQANTDFLTNFHPVQCLSMLTSRLSQPFALWKICSPQFFYFFQLCLTLRCWCCCRQEAYCPCWCFCHSCSQWHLYTPSLTEGIYTQHSLGYNVLASNATLLSLGGIALFWRGNISHKVEEMRVWGPNVINLHLMMGACQFFVMRCYILPSNLTTLACVNEA